MTKNEKPLSDLLYDARKKKGWTQKQLAERLNVTDGYVCQWESGRLVPALRLILSTAKILGANANKLEAAWEEAQKESAAKRLERKRGR